MKKITSPEAYLQEHPEYAEELRLLLEIVRQFPELEEAMKWSLPVYSVGGKNVVGLGAFKSYVGLWFFQGVFIQDRQGLLINANEEETKALRQMRFESGMEEIAEKRQIIEEYIQQAIQNQLAGREIKPEKKGAPEIPEILQKELDRDPELQARFLELTQFKQREYCEHISSAKREATQKSRLEKSLPLILAGKGLNDKYRDC